MNYELRPLLLKDVRQIHQAKILGSFPSLKACREHLRTLLQASEDSDRHPYVFTAGDEVLCCLIDAPASPDTYLRLLTLFTPDTKFGSEKDMEGFEDVLYEYLVKQGDMTGAYLLLGGFEEVLPQESKLPLKKLGSVPLVLAPSPGSNIDDLKINMVDLRDVMADFIAFYPTKQTLLILKADQDAIVSLDFHKPGASFEDMQTRRWAAAVGFVESELTEPWVQPNSPEHLFEAVEQLREYFLGEREEFELPLRAQGTEFQRTVWEVLKTIPYGEPWSYLQVSEKLSTDPEEARNKARAVGAACGANPLPIFVPCHRVLSSEGKLHGFRGGLKVKAALLDHEMLGRLFS